MTSTALIKGFEQPRFDEPTCPADEKVYQSWMHYLTNTLGRDEASCHRRAMADVTREPARRLVQSLLDKGVIHTGSTIIDVGSGHGTLSIELARAGLRVTAVEPCDAWRELSIERAEHYGVSIAHVNGAAEDLPLADESFDSLISLQVLEHVCDPRKAISEMARVLRLGGGFHISCENYLAFREQHYDVAWLPLLPKVLGSLYLRMRRRDPEFLLNHVTYTTWPQLAWWFARNGLVGASNTHLFDPHFGAQSTCASRVYKMLAIVCGRKRARELLLVLRNVRKLFRVGFVCRGWKNAS